MAAHKIAVLDYGMGNIHSIIKALKLYADDVVFTSDPEELRSAKALVLPGDGAFGAAMSNLSGSLGDCLHAHVQAGKPLLGVCIGFQVLFNNSSEVVADVEGDLTEGLDLVEGRVRRFDFEDKSLSIPHMGWNQLKSGNSGNWLRENNLEDEYMYFVHSYHAEQVPAGNVLAYCDYGGTLFPAVVQKDNIFATQFHPEKSYKAGLKLIENWTAGL